MITGAPRLEDCIISDSDWEVALPGNVHLIPSSQRLADLNQWQSENSSRNPRSIFVDSIARLRTRYDYIFIDNSAPQNLHAVLALTVADFAILTARSGFVPDLPLDEALRVIGDAQKYANSKLKLLGIIACGFSRSSNSSKQKWIEYIAKTCVDSSNHTLNFDTEISHSVVIQKAQLAKRSVFRHQPNHPIADEYRKLARVLELRSNAFKSLSKASDATGEVT